MKIKNNSYSSPNKRASVELPRLKMVHGVPNRGTNGRPNGGRDFQAKLKKEQEAERQKDAVNRDELDKREEQREKLWLQRKTEMMR